MKILVYTCVFGGYDRVFPPLVVEPSVDYVIYSDEAGLRVKGWQTRCVDTSRFRHARAANRHFKMLLQGNALDYDASIYVDGNVRLLGPLSPLARRFLETGAALGVYPHPHQRSVAEEIDVCAVRGKIGDVASARRELAAYTADGFPDTDGLVEATILLKNHTHPALAPAMALWWSLFEIYDSRDQFSLPYVLWRTGLPCDWQAKSFRFPNPFFGIYPHVGAHGMPPLYAYLSARAYDSRIHRWCLGAWQAKWRLQRRLRRLAATP